MCRRKERAAKKRKGQKKERKRRRGDDKTDSTLNPIQPTRPTWFRTRAHSQLRHVWCATYRAPRVSRARHQTSQTCLGVAARAPDHTRHVWTATNQPGSTCFCARHQNSQTCLGVATCAPDHTCGMCGRHKSTGKHVSLPAHQTLRGRQNPTRTQSIATKQLPIRHVIRLQQEYRQISATLASSTRRNCFRPHQPTEF